MTSEGTYRLIAGFLLVVIFGISATFRRRADREGGTLNPELGRVLILLRLAGLGVLLPFLLYLINPAWVAWARFEAPGWLRWSGSALTAVTVPLFYWLFSTIGRNISPSHTTRQGHKLITTGPYRRIRHPLYTFSLLAWSGLGLLSAMWWLLVGWGVILLFLLYRIPREEAHLIAEFGPAYRDYMTRTGRFLPRFRG